MAVTLCTRLDLYLADVMKNKSRRAQLQKVMREVNPQETRVQNKKHKVDTLLSEVEGMSFDKSHIESEILAIANPKKAEAIMKAKREEEERLQEEERIKEEQARLIKEGIDAERAKIWNFLDRFCEEIKSGTRLNGHSRYALGNRQAFV